MLIALKYGKKEKIKNKVLSGNQATDVMDECKLSAAPQLKQLSVHRPAELMALLDLAGLAEQERIKQKHKSSGGFIMWNTWLWVSLTRRWPL